AGTDRYQPTLTQRRAVIARQKGVCATPGCNHTHLEIHHTIWWSRGGPTDLDLLIGLCVRCHHLLHRGLLNITGNAVDGFEFTNRHRRPIRRRRNHFHQAA
ncbi:HNH endonuclease, partial [Aeromicrobium panaciterrae]|uniref:HNH endonuclease n=1 Tax=Aeromicrobium panaciterrae TaxID=363861 RepID=UPI0031CFBC63